MILITACAVFFLRSPVVIVTDPSFNLLYGTTRAIFKQIDMSLKFYRRIILVSVSENAPRDIVTETVKASSVLPVVNLRQTPRAVFFSGFFSMAAYRYQEESPDIPVFIIDGRNESRIQYEKQGVFPVHIGSDLENDLFRAGVCAGLLNENYGRVLVYQAQALTSAQRAAFEKGLESQNFYTPPVYIASAGEFSAWQTISLVVITGASARFFELNQKIPVILFSWIDPEITPANVKAVFDDSSWALASAALEMLESDSGDLTWGNRHNFPSQLVIPKGRTNEKSYFIEKTVKQGKYIGLN